MTSTATPLVSVIIPTYNRARLLPRAIASVFGQTYPRIEAIIVDDGSTDETPEVLRQYGDRIQVVRQANAGPASARNRGIAVASGEIIAFLDSDDQWMPTKLERQVASLEASGPEVVCCLCNCSVRFANGKTGSTFAIAQTMPDRPTGTWLNPVEILLNRFVLFNQAVAIRRKVLDVGCFDESLRFAEDYELSFRLALAGPWTIIRDELVVYHEASPGSLATAAIREEIRFREDLVRIREGMAAALEIRPAFAKLRRAAQRELDRERRELSIAQLGRRSILGASALARSLAVIERVRRAVYRRSPFFPRVILNDATAYHL